MVISLQEWMAPCRIVEGPSREWRAGNRRFAPASLPCSGRRGSPEFSREQSKHVAACLKREQATVDGDIHAKREELNSRGGMDKTRARAGGRESQRIRLRLLGQDVAANRDPRQNAQKAAHGRRRAMRYMSLQAERGKGREPRALCGVLCGNLDARWTLPRSANGSSVRVDHAVKAERIYRRLADNDTAEARRAGAMAWSDADCPEGCTSRAKPGC